MKPQAPAIHIPILQALPKGGLPFKVSLPQSSTLQVGGKAHFALQNDHFPRSFRVLAYRSLVLLRVPQHEAQMSAVHRGDGGTP